MSHVAIGSYMVVLFASSILANPAFAQTFQRFQLAPGANVSIPLGADSAGSFIAGRTEPFGTYKAATWNAANQVRLLTSPSGGSFPNAYDVSANGQLVVGSVAQPGTLWVPATWSGDGPGELLTMTSGREIGEATNVSDDGLIISGWVGGGPQSPPARPFIYTASSGMTELSGWYTQQSAFTTAMSGDGRVIVGYGGHYNGQNRAFRWTAETGMQDLGLVVPGAFGSTASGISANGNYVVGSSGGIAYVWTESGGMAAHIMPGTTRGEFLGISDNGLIIVGNRASATGGTVAVIRRPELGIVDLSTYLQSFNFDLRGWQLTSATGISADGSVIYGYGTFNGNTQGWVARTIPTPSTGIASLMLATVTLRRRRFSAS